jgi:hypothetical protein
MRKLTASLLILSVLSLNAAVLAASVTCPLMGDGAGMQSGCCCGEDSTCELPVSKASLAGTCCEVSANGSAAEHAPPAIPAAPVSLQYVPGVQMDQGAPPVVKPTRHITVQNFDTDRPPPYRLFCSLLI